MAFNTWSAPISRPCSLPSRADFWGALALTLPAALAFGLALEILVFRWLYDRDHLAQILATFGIILFLNQGVKTIWGAAPLSVPMPALLSESIVLMPGLLFPVYRLALIGVGLATALALYLVINHTRVGMLVRAGSTNAQMVSALGVDIRRLFMVVFGFGPCLQASRARWSRRSFRSSPAWATIS